MNQFEAIRQYRHVPAFRGRSVTYHGQRYRISGVSDTGGLILRSQHIVHPTDPALRYSGVDGVERLKERVAREAQAIEDWVNQYTCDDLQELLRVRNSFLHGLEAALRLIENQEASS